MLNIITPFRIILYIVWVSIVSISFNYFAYPIDDFNAAVRTFIKTGSKNIRVFNDKGQPVSYSPRLGEFISPFYIVHYGILYSNALGGTGLHWRRDPSLDYWNVQPPTLPYKTKVQYFKNSADWIVDNSVEFSGHLHLLYKFDWPYQNYPNALLKAPWWSGLTDSYALILLLRAYDYFGDVKYLETAEKLYEAVLSPVDNGGSLNKLNGCLWIEEYVDHRAKAEDMSFVFNGMVYASHAIEAYEVFSRSDEPIYPKLYQCIANNVVDYDMGGWSYYDGIGSPTTIKYHGISYVLLDDLIRQNKVDRSVSVTKVLTSWRTGFDNPGYNYILNGPKSISYYHFVITFILSCIAPIACFGLIRVVKSEK